MPKSLSSINHSINSPMRKVSDAEYDTSTIVQTKTVNHSDSTNVSDYHINTEEIFPPINNNKETNGDDLESQEKRVLKETIKPRHTKMIGLASGIGTGLLVASGGQISAAGIGGTLVSYCIVGVMIITMFYSCSELVVAFPTINYTQYGKKFVDPSVGFAISWIYCIQWMTVVPLELITASMTIKYWNDSLSPSIFITVFYILIFGIAFCGARGYAEAEFFFNFCKVTMLLGFVILGVILGFGTVGTQSNHFDNTENNYYRTPGAFNTSHSVFKSICSTLIASTFACGGVEFVALTVIEQDKTNITKSMKAIGIQVICRMVCLVLIPLAVIGWLVPYTSSQLLGSGSSSVHASPFVVAITSHGIKIVPSIINAVIIIAVLSVANSGVYTSSRTLRSLALQDFAPKYFTQLDKKGRPMRALYVTFAFGLVSYLAEYKDQETVFNWLLAVGGISAIFTWSIICISHLRFKQAVVTQKIPKSELGCTSPTGRIGSYIGILINVFIICVSFWTSMWPTSKGGKTDVLGCLQINLGILVTIVLYIGHKSYTKTWNKLYLKSNEIDINSDRSVYHYDPILKKTTEIIPALKTSEFEMEYSSKSLTPLEDNFAEVNDFKEHKA